MTNEPITIGTQKIIYDPKKGWIDSKTKSLVPKNLIPMLEQISPSSSSSPESASKDTPDKLLKPMPSIGPVSSTNSVTDKLTKSLDKLTKSLEVLTKLIDKNAKPAPGSAAKPAYREYEQGKIPTIAGAMGANIKDAFMGTRDKYGRTTDRGILKKLSKAAVLPSAMIFAAQDRKRNVIANELEQYETDIKNKDPIISQKQIDEKINQKRLELENPKKSAKKLAVAAPVETAPPIAEKLTAKEVAVMKAKNPELTSEQALQDFRTNKTAVEATPIAVTKTGPKSVAEQILGKSTAESSGEKERAGMLTPEGKSEFAAKDVDTKVQSVKIVDIDESVLKKLKHAIMGGKGKGEGAGEDEGGGGGGGGILGGLGLGGILGGLKKSISKAFSGIKNIFKGGGAKAAATEAEIVKDAAGKSRYAAGAVDAAGKNIGGQFVKAESAAAKTAATEGARSAAKPAANVAKTAATQGARSAAKPAANVAKTAAKAGGSIEAKIGKLLAKNTGKILGKSLAGVGVLFGAWDMAKHAAKGDWVGVGLDAVAVAGSTAELTGVGAAVGGPVAILASVTSVLRDGYKDIFGVEPEKDPNFKSNMNTAISAASNWVSEKLGMEHKKTEKGAGSSEALKQVDAITKGSTAVSPASGPSGTYVANQRIVPGQQMSKEQRGATEMNIAMGNTPSPEIMKAYNTPSPVAPSSSVPAAAAIKPAGVTPQTQNLSLTTQKVETAKQQKTNAGPTIINNNTTSAPTNISHSQPMLGGPTLADRGSLNISSFA
jgi:hypothetical protein